MFYKTLAVVAAIVVAGWASAAQAAPKYTCYVNDNYAVSSADSADDANTVFSVLRKTAADRACNARWPRTGPTW